MGLASISQIDEFTILQFLQLGICTKKGIISFKQLICNIPRPVGHLLLPLPVIRCLGFVDLCDLDEPTNLSVHFDFQGWYLKFSFEFRFQFSKPSVTARCDFSQLVDLGIKAWAQ